MAEKSTGQWVGAVVGAAAGYFTGGASYISLGMTVGGAVGGAIDPPKGPKIVGPRLSDMSQQGSSYGAPIPRIYVSCAMYGNIFWIENNALKEVSKTDGGGKGGGGSEVQTFQYQSTFALGLCEGPISGIRRIWIGGSLFYDAGADDAGTIMASNRSNGFFRIYLGSETQEPDPRMQAALGVANCPAYRGLAYLVFDDLPMEKYGNTLIGAQIKVEVVETATVEGWEEVVYKADTGKHYMVNPEVGDLPYIAAVDDGIIRVVTVGETWFNHLYDLDGNYLGKELAKRVYTTANDGNVITLGTLERHDCYVDPTLLPQDAACLWVIRDGNQVFLDRNLPANEQIMAAVISNDEHLIFVVMAAAGTINSSLVRQWFVIDPDGEIVRSGVTDATANKYTFGLGRACNLDRYVSSAFDQEMMRVATADGAGWPNVFIYSIDDDDVLRQEMNFSHAHQLFTYPAIYFEANAVYLLFGSSYSMMRTEKIINETVPLSEIIESETLRSGVLEASDIDVISLTDPVRGYRIASSGALRANIEPLQGAWPFDVIQSGYKVKFIRRGASTSALAIPADDLGAYAGGDKDPVRITKSREMDTQLPWRVSVTHLDYAREYDIGEQYAERLNTESVNTRQVELPIVMTATEAARVVESLLYMYWLERYDVSLSLPPSYGGLEPGDVVDIDLPAQQYSLRIVGINYQSSGVIEVTAKFNSAAVYSSTAVGVESAPISSTITLRGPANYQLLDLPTISDDYNGPGMIVAMGGYLSTWRSGTLFRSFDGGQTWDDANTFAAPGIIGFGRNSIAAPADFRLFDAASVLEVQLYSGVLSSVSELQLLSGANYFAYGDDQRWEVIAAKNCDLQGDGSYLLTDLLRGTFGSEWAMGLHQAGDRVIALNKRDVQVMGLGLSMIGQAIEYRAVTSGRSLEDAAGHEFIYRGENLKPLPPVYLNGNRDEVTSDWNLTWQRRTRVGGAWRDAVDVSLGEASEAYEIDIYDGPAYSVVKRTLAVGTAAVVYTSAQQVADFGVQQGTLYIKLYQISADVGRGRALVASITRLTGMSDVYFSYVTRLLHLSGSNGSTTFTDVIGHTITATGTPTISSAVTHFSANTLLLNNTSSVAANWLTLGSGSDFNFGSTDFTVEFWLYQKGAVADMFVLANDDASVFAFKTTFDTRFNFSVNATASSFGTLVLNQWMHVAIVRYGSSIKVYIDGVAQYTVSLPGGTVDGSAKTWMLGARTGGWKGFDGYLSDLRITKGVARYTTTFTQPTAPLNDRP